MNIGTGGALFLWVLMLWPIIVAIGYHILFRPQVKNVPALAVTSIVIGYAAMFGIMMLTDVFERWVVHAEFLVIALPLVVPVLSTHILARLASKQSQGGAHA